MLKKGKGKPTFELLNNVHIDVTADKANIAYFTDAIQQHWGDDGMEIEDSAVTRGRKFL